VNTSMSLPLPLVVTISFDSWYAVGHLDQARRVPPELPAAVGEGKPPAVQENKELAGSPIKLGRRAGWAALVRIFGIRGGLGVRAGRRRRPPM